MIFSCQHSFRNIEKMFQGISDVLKTAVEVIAPAPSLCQELEYHWKQLKKFYVEKDNSPPRRHISTTNLPHHLESILQTLITEDSNETEKNKECMQFILTNRPIDILLQLSISDDPPGMKICLLNWLRRFLSCLKEPPLEHASIFQPVLNFVRICNGKVPSPYEEEEILFLETVAGLIRKNPFLLDIFIPSHQQLANVNSTIKGTKIVKFPIKNQLFECTKLETNIRRIEIVSDDNSSSTPNTSNHENDSNCDIKSSSSLMCGADENNIYSNKNCDCVENDRFQLLDTILTYSESPDSKIVVRACEAALILTSLPTLNMNCPSIIASLEDYTYYLIDKLIYLYEQIPDDMDSDNLEDCSVSWGLIPREPDGNQFIGKQQIYEFLRWYDYTDSVAAECVQVAKLLTKFRTEFLLKCVEPSLIATDTPFVLLLLSKMIKQIRSTKIMIEISNWLIGETITSELYSATDCLLTIIIDNIQDNPEILIAGLQFIEALLDNPHENILNEMIFRYINKRGYYDISNGRIIQSWSDEEDERDRRRSSIDEQIKSKTLSPHNILKVINHFLLLLPRQTMSESNGTCYEEYVQDASRHYKIWVKKTLNFVWPREAYSQERDETITISPISGKKRTSCSESCIGGSGNVIDHHCNDSGISEEIFYEGPLLKLLFTHVQNMALQTCDVNLAIIAILSKLAFLPHPYLHEILLNPEIPVSSGSSTLWNSLKVVARQLLLEIPKCENYQKRIGDTSKRLLSPIKDDENEFDRKGDNDETEQLFEAIVILEEFCKELAAIAFVKYHHATE